MKKAIAVLLTVSLMLLLTSCLGVQHDKTFDVDGLKITLTDRFTENSEALDGLQKAFTELMEQGKATDDYTSEAVYYLENANVGICFWRCKPQIPLDLNSFKDILRANYLALGYPVSESKKEDDFRYFEVETDDTIMMSACYYNGGRLIKDVVFWVVQFYCQSKYYDYYRDTFVKWAKSVTIDKQL